ncbi:MAG: histidinol-phosphate aminotransferase family protein [Planctomycetes bacterium]|nr:histidinol-phosphate aminotransferase family protein [Planctomycetota bacterium]
MATPPKKAFHGGASFDAIGSDFADLSRRHDIVDADVLDAWYEPAPEVLATLREHLPWLVKTSPPTHGEGLRETIAARHGLSVEQVILGGGTSSLMYLAFPKLVRPGDTVAILDPMYGEYRHIFENVLGAKVVSCELQEADGFVPEPQLIADAVRESGAKLLVMVNPNSPTGVVMERDDMHALLAALPKSTRVWIDETYIDFVPDVPTAEGLVHKDPRVIVAKSMSKFFALSGLRVGYLCAAAPLVAELEVFNPPWSAGLLAQCAAMGALREYAWYRQRATETHAMRDELMQRIGAVRGLTPFASVTNFFLFATDKVPAALLVDRCREQGVFVRDCASLSPRFGGRFVRTAVKDRKANERIAAAIEAAAG